MRVPVIAIGNSKGVRIPKALLEESGLSSVVELRAVKGKIIMSAPKTNKQQVVINGEYAFSLSSLHDWETDEEDRTWAHLQ